MRFILSCLGVIGILLAANYWYVNGTEAFFAKANVFADNINMMFHHLIK